MTPTRITHIRRSSGKRVSGFTLRVEDGAFHLLDRYHKEGNLECYTCRHVIDKNHFAVVQASILTKTLIVHVICPDCIRPFEDAINTMRGYGQHKEKTVQGDLVGHLGRS